MPAPADVGAQHVAHAERLTDERGRRREALVVEDVHSTRDRLDPGASQFVRRHIVSGHVDVEDGNTHPLGREATHQLFLSITTR